MSRLGKRFNNLIIIICGRNLCVFKWRASGDSLSSAVRDSRNQFSQNFNSIFDNTHYQTRAQILEYVQFSIGLCCAAVEMWNFAEPSRVDFLIIRWHVCDGAEKIYDWKAFFPLLSKWIYEIHFECELRKWKVDVCDVRSFTRYFFDKLNIKCKFVLTFQAQIILICCSYAKYKICVLATVKPPPSALAQQWSVHCLEKRNIWYHQQRTTYTRKKLAKEIYYKKCFQHILIIIIIATRIWVNAFYIPPEHLLFKLCGDVSSS